MPLSAATLLLLTVLRFLAAGYADPHAVRRLGRARLTRLIWRWSHGAWGEDHASRILAAAAGSLQLWDTELSYPDLAEDIAAEARLALALCTEIRDLDTKIAALLRQRLGASCVFSIACTAAFIVLSSGQPGWRLPGRHLACQVGARRGRNLTGRHSDYGETTWYPGCGLNVRAGSSVRQSAG